MKSRGGGGGGAERRKNRGRSQPPPEPVSTLRALGQRRTGQAVGPGGGFRLLSTAGNSGAGLLKPQPDKGHQPPSDKASEKSFLPLRGNRTEYTPRETSLLSEVNTLAYASPLQRRGMTRGPAAGSIPGRPPATR